MSLRKAEFLAFTKAQAKLPELRLAIEKAIEAFIAERKVVIDFMIAQGLSEDEAIAELPTVPGPPRPRKSNGQIEMGETA
jgi:hypothetical protein